MDTSEKNFESLIESHLTANGWTARKWDKHYDRELCLDSDMLFEFILATQPEAWNKLKVQRGGDEQARDGFLKRLAKEIETRGALDVLRKGVVDLGCKFDLACFKPETTLNVEHRDKYRANRFSVIRQLHYSTKDDKSIDLALFLNGIPIITAELKNPFKGQNVLDAVKQYKYDRDPKEPLLKFKRCLAHFAVDPELVYMTTRLQGGATRFLPFNKGRNNGAGNPDNPDGFKTAYLWEQVWERDSLLDIINNFIQAVTEEKEEDGRKIKEEKLIFPRYHQLDAVRRLVTNAKAAGPGQNYLVQHSAGSGKSNSIAWLCHRLAGLHDDKNKRIFDSIIVVTDRRVLDKQLRDTVKSFEQVKGTVVTVEKHKSKELADALMNKADVIVTTLQTFPFVMEKLGELPQNRFAVVVDEAHSSQTGETTKSMKEVLAAAGLDEAEREDGAEGPDDEDELNASVEAAMKKRGKLDHVSFFAFTATPKPKTLELFGDRRPDGTFWPFSLYSMRQAIEEGFILDVLKNYTTYKSYFNLIKKIEDDPKYDKRKGAYLLRSYVDKHEHNIRRKTEVMIEHFINQVKDRVGGKAKVMLVTRSRLHAVRFKQAFDKYLKEKKYPYRALVAFSGTVRDPDTGAEFTETGMNGFPESQTAEMFKKGENRFLIVANKFQTGFDQPLLHTMYVDKKLGGVHAVQTLSRLNRTRRDKEDTMVLDFTNDAEEIQKSFQPYYETTILSEGTDPNKLYDLQRMLEEFGIYTSDDVDKFARVYFGKNGRQDKLQHALDAPVQRFDERGTEEQEDFRKKGQDFVRLYAFLSHLLVFTDVELEKLYQFMRHLLRLLPVDCGTLPVEITQNINMDTYRLQQTSKGDIQLISQDGELRPISDLGTGGKRPEDLAPLSEIIEYINKNYGTEFTDDDRVRYFAADMERRLVGNTGLVNALDPKINPSVDNQRLSFTEFFSSTLEDMIETNFEIYKKIVDDPAFGDLFRGVMFDRIQKSLQGQPEGDYE